MQSKSRRALSAETFGLMARVVHRTSQDASTILRAEGLNPAQFQLLLAVSRNPGGYQRRFGEQASVTQSNISMLVTKLEEAGLLRRSAEGAANQLWLTEAGKVVLERLEPDQGRFMGARFAALSSAELAELHRLLDLVAKGLEANETDVH